MTFFDLVVQTSGSLHPNGEPDDYISEYTGFLYAAGDDQTRRRVGKLHAWRIHADAAAADGESLFDVCDAHSHELHVVHTLLYEPGEYAYQEAIADRFGDAGWDTLVLDYVLLNPKWRGLRLGLLAVRKLLDLVGGGCGLAVCNIAPLRHEAHGLLKAPASWLPRNGTPDERQEAARKLRRHFRRMGFERLARTPYFALSMAREAPTLSDLLRPTKGGRP
jgi:hypothetical protein